MPDSNRLKSLSGSLLGPPWNLTIALLHGGPRSGLPLRARVPALCWRSPRDSWRFLTFVAADGDHQPTPPSLLWRSHAMKSCGPTQSLMFPWEEGVRKRKLIRIQRV